MGRPSIDNPRNTVLQCKTSEDVVAAVEVAAKAAGLSISSYIENLILKNLKSNKKK